MALSDRAITRVCAVLSDTVVLPPSDPERVEYVQLRVSSRFVEVLRSLVRVAPTAKHPLPGDALAVLARAGLRVRLSKLQDARRRRGYYGDRERPPEDLPEDVVEEPSSSSTARVMVNFRALPEERDRYDAAARAEGLTRTEWIRSRLAID